MSDAIVRILPLSALMNALMRNTGVKAPNRGWPTRIVACPVQVRHWACQAAMSSREMLDPPPTNLHIMGIPVVEGAHDAQPELIWSVPVTGE